MLGSPAVGTTVHTYLVALTPAGALLDSLLIRRAQYPAMGTGYTPQEDDFEVIPRVAMGEDERVYVQRDMYRWEVECYDEELHLLWQCHRDIDPTERTPAEIEAHRASSTFGFEPSKYRHVIRRIVPRVDGEVWVETMARKAATDGTVVLDRIDSQGKVIGRAHLSGLPAAEGEFEIFGDRLLWKLDDDAEGEAGLPYLAVYRLVAGG